MRMPLLMVHMVLTLAVRSRSRSGTVITQHFFLLASIGLQVVVGVRLIFVDIDKVSFFLLFQHTVNHSRVNCNFVATKPNHVVGSLSSFYLFPCLHQEVKAFANLIVKSKPLCFWTDVGKLLSGNP